jgi:hypothetical protein
MLAGLDRAIAEGSEDRVTDAVQRLAGRPARAGDAQRIRRRRRGTPFLRRDRRTGTRVPRLDLRRPRAACSHPPGRADL